MRILLLEIRRILCSRRNIILLLAGLVLSVVMGIVPITYERASYLDPDGNIMVLTGRDAIEYHNSLYEPIEGDVTPEKLENALSQYQEAIREAGGLSLYDEEFPTEIRVEKINPVDPLLFPLPAVYSDPGTGLPAELTDISLEEIPDFYDRAVEHIGDLAAREYGSQDVVDKATEMYQQIDMPFQLYGDYSANALEYIVLNIFLLFLICVAIAAPTFSENYENGSDHILRCTRYGRRHCAGLRLLALVLIFTVYYLICMGIEVRILNQAFGTESLKTSVQMVWQVIALVPLNIGELQRVSVLGGLLSLLSSTCLAVFISARMKSAMVSMLFSLIVAILPTILYFAVGLSWLVFLWPSSGVGMQNSLMYQLQDTNFLIIGDRGVWVPWVIITAAAVELVVFAALSIRTYCKHQVV